MLNGVPGGDPLTFTIAVAAGLLVYRDADRHGHYHALSASAAVGIAALVGFSSRTSSGSRSRSMLRVKAFDNVLDGGDVDGELSIEDWSEPADDSVDDWHDEPSSEPATRPAEGADERASVEEWSAETVDEDDGFGWAEVEAEE